MTFPYTPPPVQICWIRGAVRFLPFIAILLIAACAGVRPYPDKQLIDDGKRQEDIARGQGCVFLDKGMASWYGYEMHGNRTANGEWFVPEGITAAHRTLPFGTMVKVVMDGGKGNQDGVIVRINDRGPFIKGRIIDLSMGAAQKLGMKDTKAVHIYRCS
jgi:rare lipoprotein A (peptidoglycan hydrolase)